MQTQINVINNILLKAYIISIFIISKSIIKYTKFFLNKVKNNTCKNALLVI